MENNTLLSFAPKRTSFFPNMETKMPQAYQDYVIKNIIEPAYTEDLKFHFTSRSHWRKISRIFVWTSNLFVLCAGIFSFFQVQMHDTTYWSMGAGVCNVLALIFLNFGLDAKKEEFTLTKNLNDVLQSIGLDSYVLVPPNAPQDDIKIKTNDRRERVS